MARRLVGPAAGLGLALLLGLLPSVGQLDRLGQSALAIIALAVVFWAADVLNSAVTTIFCLGLV